MTDEREPMAWPADWGSPSPRRPIAFLVLGVALATGGMAALLLSHGAPGPMASGVVLLLVAFTAFLVFARAPFGSGRPRPVSTSGLSEAWKASGDSALHLILERRTGAMLLIICSVWALVFAVTTVVAIRIGLEGRFPAFVGAVVVGVFTVLFAAAAVRSAIRQTRARPGSSNPVGLGVGPSGLTVVLIGSTRFIPWSAVRAVEAAHTTSRRGMREAPLIRLRVDARRVVRGGRASDAALLTLRPDAYRIHPAVLWSALHAGTRNPGVRRTFGATSGDRLFAGWDAARRPAP